MFQLLAKAVLHWKTVAREQATQYAITYRIKSLQNRLKERIWFVEMARSKNSVATLAMPETNLYRT